MQGLVCHKLGFMDDDAFHRKVFNFDVENATQLNYDSLSRNKIFSACINIFVNMNNSCIFWPKIRILVTIFRSINSKILHSKTLFCLCLCATQHSQSESDSVHNNHLGVSSCNENCNSTRARGHHFAEQN